MKTGEVWWNPETGRKFTVKKLDRKEIHVEVERVVRKGERSVIDCRLRVVPRSIWSDFTKAYVPCEQ